MEELVQKSIEIQGWLLLKFFIYLHNQLSSFNSTVVSYRCLKNVIHQIDSINGWLLLSVIFTSKLEVGFCLNIQKCFFLELSF